jgi:hypothetical protein
LAHAADPTSINGPIELRLHTARQLFHTLDPTPFREGDLDAEAENYIVEWARELPRRHPIEIILHLPAGELASAGLAEIGPAIRRFFANRARSERNAIRELFRSGYRALGIGLAILAACLLVAIRAGAWLPAGSFSRILQESLIIIGWVAIWRPAEIFLYDWLPYARRLRLFTRLEDATVSLRESTG